MYIHVSVCMYVCIDEIDKYIHGKMGEQVNGQLSFLMGLCFQCPRTTSLLSDCKWQLYTLVYMYIMFVLTVYVYIIECMCSVVNPRVQNVRWRLCVHRYLSLGFMVILYCILFNLIIVNLFYFYGFLILFY